MAYHPDVMREAREKYREAVRVFNEKEEVKKKSLLKRSPRLQETAGELDHLSLRMAHAALMGLPEEISKIRAQAEEIHQRQGDILAEMGEKRDSLRPHYMCPKCEDAGSTGSGDCECMLRVYKDMMLEKYRLYIGDATLDKVDSSLYSAGALYDNVSPRMIMEYNVNTCRTYAESFAVGKGSGLYISGDCGVGKTYLASATVREVIERGFYVHCISAMELFPIYDRSRFGRWDEDERAMLESCFDADLLFLDDLGGEVASVQNAPFLARLLNDRINQGRGTIIASQLKLEDLAKRYSPQVRSRVEGAMENLSLFGNDLRKA